MATFMKVFYVIATGVVASLIANFFWEKFKSFTDDLVTISNIEYQTYLLSKIEPQQRLPNHASLSKDCLKLVFDKCIGKTAVGFVNQDDNKLMEPQTLGLCQSLRNQNPLLRPLVGTNIIMRDNRLTTNEFERVLVGFVKENKIFRSDSILNLNLPQLKDMVSSEIDVKFLIYDSTNDSLLAQCSVKEQGIGRAKESAIQNAIDKIIFTYFQK